MKNIIPGLLLLLSPSSFTQEIKFGLELSPVFNLNLHHSKTNTTWSSEKGYGFNVGFAVKYWFNDQTAINTGLNFEYVSFDSYAFNALQSRLSFGSLNIPLIFSHNFTGTWHALFGAGVNYNLINRYRVLGSKVDITPSIDSFQPYIGLGASTLLDRSSGLFELGVLARYHFMELWDESYAATSGFSSHIVAIDLMMRFYL